MATTGRQRAAAPTVGHIVVVDDEADMRQVLQEYLSEEGFRVTAADGGEAMWGVLERDPADLIVLDLKMPGEDGHALARRLRARSDVGIIMLTGRGQPVDTIVGLEVGVDDYVTKPCDLRELLARIRAVLRRRRPGTAEIDAAAGVVLAFAGWTLDTARRELAAANGEPVALTTAEYALLSLLAERPGRVLSRDQLLEMTQGRTWSPYDRSLDNLVSRLRRKIEKDARNPAIIKTVRGVGYVFAETVKRVVPGRR